MTDTETRLAAWQRLQAERLAAQRAQAPLDPRRPHSLPWHGQVIEASRRSLGLTQRQLAAAIGVPIGTIRAWEQDRTMPAAPARALLTVLAREPEAALRALAG